MIMKNDNRLEQSLPGAARSVVCRSRNKTQRAREARADLARVTQHSCSLSCIRDTWSSRSILYHNVSETLSLEFLADLKEITLKISDRREISDKNNVVHLNVSGPLSQKECESNSEAFTVKQSIEYRGFFFIFNPSFSVFIFHEYFAINHPF